MTRLHPLVRDILVKRGIESEEAIEAFINPDYTRSLHDPFLMKGMQAAVKRILEAVEKKQKVVIYGDYDIDGITASTVMLETFNSLGLPVKSYIPDRFEEGYGINLAALKKLNKDGVDLVVTVDCGITSMGEVAWAMKNGLDIIITDHHSVPEEVPAAIAVLNPKQADCAYPFKELAGVGVAFKLAQALQKETGKPEFGHEKWLLDVVALGTVCDVVPLIDENRTMAKFGLLVLNKTRRVGLQALAQVSGVDMGTITSYTLGFMFGPRLNAAGRLEHAAKSLELLLTDDATRAATIAAELDALNKQRQAEQATIVDEAIAQAGEFESDGILVLASPDWSHGIVGIAASKVAERTGKPTLIMQDLGENSKGSARSFGGFNLIEAMRSAASIFTKFGGHAFAAGYTLPSSKVGDLRAALNSYFVARKTVLNRQRQADTVVSNFSGLDWDMLEGLQLLEPFGNSNAKPTLQAKATIQDLRWVGSDGRHAKLRLSDGSKTFEAIGFGLADTHADLKAGDVYTVLAQLDRNDFNGNSTLQLIVRDIMPKDASASF